MGYDPSVLRRAAARLPPPPRLMASAMIFVTSSRLLDIVARKISGVFSASG